MLRLQYDPLTGNLMGEALIQSGLRRGSNPGIQRRFDALTVETLARRKTFPVAGCVLGQDTQ